MPGAGILASLARGSVVASPEDGAFRIGGLVSDRSIALRAELDGQFSDVVTVTVGPGMEQQGVVLRMQ